jgi:hypothetical protein
MCNLLAGWMGSGPGGTANLAVLDGNLPPSRSHDTRSPIGACRAPDCPAGRPTEPAGGPFHPEMNGTIPARAVGRRRVFSRNILIAHKAWVEVWRATFLWVLRWMKYWRTSSMVTSSGERW